MKKIKEFRIKEFEKTILLVDIILYLLIIFIGYVFVRFTDINIKEIIAYNETLYFILAFIYILSYVVNRRKNNYEYLTQGFICTYTSAYLCFNEHNVNIISIIGTALFIYSVSYMINKVYNGIKLYKNKNINFISKISIGIVIGFVGIYISTIAYKAYLGINYVIGYYFVLYGLINLLEPFIEILLNNSFISSKIYLLFKYDKKEAKVKKQTKKVREIKNIRIKKK